MRIYMRLFIAIDMPAEVIQVAEQIQYYFKTIDIFNGHYTNPDGLHCTLKFLGDVDDQKIEELCNRLKTIQVTPQLAFTGSLGLFSSKNYLRILYLHIVCPALIELIYALDFIVPEVPHEKQEFINHVTLARIKSVRDKERLLHEVDMYQVPRIDFIIKEFVLKKSELTPHGAIYSDVMRFALK